MSKTAWKAFTTMMVLGISPLYAGAFGTFVPLAQDPTGLGNLMVAFLCCCVSVPATILLLNLLGWTEG